MPTMMPTMDLLLEARSIHGHLQKGDLIPVSPSKPHVDATASSSPQAAPSSFANLPPELLVSILASCDNFNDVFALVQSCKRFRHAYAANAAQVVGPVALRCFMVCALNSPSSI